jgi:FixJ family two-component response regulator
LGTSVAVDRTRVAIVDDDASVLTALGRLLRAWSFNPVRFSSGQAFLRALHNGPPQVFVLDLQMPDMNGSKCNPS